MSIRTPPLTPPRVLDMLARTWALLMISGAVALPATARAQDEEPPTLEEASVLASGQFVSLVFNEILLIKEEDSGGEVPEALRDAFTLTVDGSGQPIKRVETECCWDNSKTVVIYPETHILEDQTVVVSYDRPGADALADLSTNEVESFTTGAGGVPAVVNNSELEPPPPPPQFPAAYPLLPNLMIFRWQDDFDDESTVRYDFRFRAVGSGWGDLESAPRRTDGGGLYQIFLTELTAGTRYLMEVRAKGGGGSESDAVFIDGTAAGPPTVSIRGPSGTVTEGDDLRFTLSRQQDGPLHRTTPVFVQIRETGDVIPRKQQGLRSVRFPKDQTRATLVVKTEDDDGDSDPASLVTAKVTDAGYFHLPANDPDKGVHKFDVTDGERVELRKVKPYNVGTRGSTRKTVNARTAALTLSVDDAEATEGDDDAVRFTVRLNRNPNSEVTVDYRTRDGTAEGGSDYTETSGTLTFEPGENAKTVSVPILDDDGEDDGETFTLELSNPSGADFENDDGEAVGTIRNSDTPLTASFSAVPASHDGENRFNFKVAFSEDFTLDYRDFRRHAFEVAGGAVTKVNRRVKGSSRWWRIYVEPDSDDDVTIGLPEATDCDATGAICTEDGRPLSHSLSATVRGPEGPSEYRPGGRPGGGLCAAVAAGGEDLAPASAAAALWKDGGDLSPRRIAALDALGNGNGRYDLGDMLAWTSRCRPGAAPDADAATTGSPPLSALHSSRRAGRAKRRRKGGAGGPRRRLAAVPGADAAGGSAARWWRAALLVVIASAWGCGIGDTTVEPHGDPVRDDALAAAVPDPGFLPVRLTVPSRAGDIGAMPDIGAMLVVEGPAIDSLSAPGLELFETDESSSTRREVVIAGPLLPGGPVLLVWVPHRGDHGRYRVSLLQVAGADFTLRDPTGYGTAISR